MRISAFPPGYALKLVQDNYQSLEVQKEVPESIIASPASSYNTCLSGKDGRYFFKCLPITPVPPPASLTGPVAASIQFQNTLFNSGLPIHLPELNQDGGVISTGLSPTSETFSFTITRWVPHDPWLATQNRVAAMADLLANMHRVHGPWPKVLESLPRRDLFADVIHLLDESKEELRAKGFIALGHPQELRWDKAVIDVRHKLQTHRDLARNAGYGRHHVPIHGDFHCYNILYGENRLPTRVSDICPKEIVGIVDFDNVSWDDKGDDLARAAVHLEIFSLRGKLPSPAVVESSKPLIDFFMRRYASASGVKTLPFAPYFEQMICAIGIHVGILYYLKGLHPTNDVSALLDLTSAFERATFLPKNLRSDTHHVTEKDEENECS
jgi:hypothetical protein